LPAGIEALAKSSLPSDILVSKSTEILPNGEVREYEEWSVNMDMEEVQKRLNENKRLDEILAEALNNHATVAKYKQDSAKKAQKLAEKRKQEQKVREQQKDHLIAREHTDIDSQGQMAKEVLSDFLFKKRKITERINFVILDSLLKQEIKNKGISLPFEYGISTKAPVLHYASSLKYKENGLKSDKDTYIVNLFPNDLNASESYLRLYFNQDRYIIRTMWVMYASSLMLILVMLGVFILLSIRL
jgi:two-component system phosphate regulon sensor histidine kinase PhoR